MNESTSVLREHMVNGQIRTWEVLDPHVLDVVSSVPRDRFVAARYRGLAFSEAVLPLKPGRVSLIPQLQGRILQALEIQPHDRVLELGTGSGYMTACLSQLAAHVTSIDPDAELTERARSILAELGVNNCELIAGDPLNPALDRKFDVIAVLGSVPSLVPVWQDLLALGGRLFAVTGDKPLMQANLIQRVGSDDFTREVLFETVIDRLPGTVETAAFVF